MLALDGNVLACSSKSKKSIKTSTFGNEIRAAHDPLSRAILYYDLCVNLGFKFREPLRVVTDNMAVIYSITGQRFTEHSKFLAPKHLRLRQMYAAGTIRIGYIKTARNPADITTKIAANDARFSMHYKAIMQGECLIEPDEWF